MTRQPIPPSVTEWPQVLLAEKALLDYADLLKKQTEGINILTDEEKKLLTNDLLLLASELVTHMPNLIGPAKWALDTRDGLRKLCNSLDVEDSVEVDAILPYLENN